MRSVDLPIVEFRSRMVDGLPERLIYRYETVEQRDRFDAVRRDAYHRGGKP